jgi:hypothetical protein
MSLRYGIDEWRHVVILYVANTTLRAWREMMHDAFADPRFAPRFAIPVDCRTASVAPLASEVRAILSSIEANRLALGSARCAVLADFAVGYGMARMTEKLAESLDISLRAFTDESDARAWLLHAEGL